MARYEIDQNNAISVFYPGSDVAFLYQPCWPNGDVWADAAEAQSWANLYIESITNEEAPYPPNARGEVGRPKLTPEQEAAIGHAIQLKDSANTPEEHEAAQEALRAAYSFMS